MINEFAYLTVKAGQAEAFELAFGKAKHIISGMPGFISLNLYRHHDGVGRYLLHVVWQDIASHQDGFRKSAEYEQWRALLHHFYEPFPAVEYFETAVTL